jgi:hypothetical protein
MVNARIDRMLRELQSEPSHQFFKVMFGLGDAPAKPREPAIPVSLLKNAPAR